MRYRTKSTEVRAVRWTGTDISKEAILAWLGPVGRTGKVNTIVVLTPIGDAYAHVGDWIIQEEEFFFVMKNDIFQGKYEPVLEVVRSEA